MEKYVLSVDDIIITDQLKRRGGRAPDHAAENRALEALATQLAEQPENLLQKLAETLVELGLAGSAGISIEEVAEARQFRWVALAGVWSHYRNGTVPFDASPCGVVVARDKLLLFENPERFFPAARAEPLIHEAMLVPFHSGGRPVGTLWINAHTSDRKFDQEDARLLHSLARFAAAGYQMTLALQMSEAGRSKSETRLRALAHASSDVFYVMSADMSELRELSGGNFIPDATSPSRDWLREYIPPDDQSRTLVAISEAIRNKSVFELEHQVLRVDGEIGWALSRAVPVFNPAGEIIEWFGAASDVTERRRTLERLRESEELRRLAVQSGGMGTWRWDLRDKLIWGDDAFLSLWGHPPSDEPRPLATFTERMSPQGQVEMAEMVERAIEAGDEFDGQLAVVSGPTKGRWVRWRGRAEKDRSWIVNGVSFDVTDQRGKDERLRESEARHRFLIDIWAQAVWETDPHGLVIADSPSWRAYTGQSLEEWVGYGWLNAIHPDDRAFAERLWREAVTAREVVNAEFRLRDPDGGWRWTNVRAAPVLDTAGRIEKWAGMNIDIHVRKRTEAALRDSEQRFRALASAGAVSVYRMSPDWRLMYELDGGTLATTADLKENWIDKYIPEEDRPSVRVAIDRAIRSKSMFELEHRVRLADGNIGWVLSRAVPMLDERGEIVEWTGAGSDVTERREAVEAMRGSELRLRQFGEASQDILWIRDAATLQWTYLTPAFETIYGLSRDEALSGDDYRNWQHLIVPEDRARAVAAIDRVLAGEQVTFEYRVRRPSDSTIRWLRNTDFPILDDAGKVVSVGGVGHDMTDLKAVQAAIASSEGRLRMLMEGIPQLVWRSQAEGRWTWASPQWLVFTGQRQKESHSLGWLDVVHPDDHAATMLAWGEAGSHGMLDVEFRVRRAADGGWVWHHSRSVPVRDANGTVIEWLGTTTDVHALRDLQERQEVLVAELQHRTRNLISVVRSISDKTLRGAGSLADFKGQFSHRLESLARVQGLLSRTTSVEKVSFDELLRSELDAVAGDGRSGKVTLAGPSGVPIRSSTVQTFALALHELATNAVKYGALSSSNPDGRLFVSWHLEPSESATPWLHVEWKERGVIMPEVGAPAHGSGYGRELIERALPYQLHAQTTFDLGFDGVRCTIALPIADNGI